MVYNKIGKFEWMKMVKSSIINKFISENKKTILNYKTAADNNIIFKQKDAI